MRKLAYISFLFAAGCLPVLLDWPRVLLLILMIAAAAVCVTGFLRKGRRARVAAYCAMGLFCGMMWSSLYRQLYLSPVLALETDDAVMSVTISNYPQKSEYGYSAEGIAVRHGVRFRTAVYLPEDSEAEFWKPGDRVSGTCKLQVRDRKADDAYYLTVGVPMSVIFKDEITHEIASGIPARFWPAHLSHLLRSTAERLYPEDVRGLVVALLTGDKRDISAQQRSDLQISGVYHALAVSGMHVSILMSVLSVVTLKSRRLYPMIGIPVLAALIVAVPGQRKLRLLLRQRQRQSAVPNQLALLLWRDVMLHAKLLHKKAPRTLERLAQKAKFSQHILTQEELDQLRNYIEEAQTQLKSRPWYWQLRLKYVLIIY